MNLYEFLQSKTAIDVIDREIIKLNTNIHRHRGLNFYENKVNRWSEWIAAYQHLRGLLAS